MVLFVHPPKWVLQNRSHENAQLTAPTSQNFIEGGWCKFVICTTFKDQITTTNYPHHSKNVAN